MDKLLNVGEVQSALADYKQSISRLNDTVKDLETNKNQFSNAWESENATALIAEYSKLISSLQEAYNSLTAYQTKIDNVVNEFVGFDQTVTY